jgi:hypothetical protein
MKRYKMLRVYLPDRTLSSLIDPELPLDKQIIAKILERPWLNNEHNISCIPEGIYIVRKNPPKESRPYTYFRFDHVEGRNNILIHRGNETADSKGCLLACSRFTNSDHPEGLESSVKLAWMAANMPDVFELEIVKKP